MAVVQADVVITIVDIISIYWFLSIISNIVIHLYYVLNKIWEKLYNYVSKTIFLNLRKYWNESPLCFTVLLHTKYSNSEHAGYF